MPRQGLTPKQEKFAMVYHETGDASRAYREAYNVRPGTKQETIARTAHGILHKPNVNAMVEELRQKIAEKHEITADRLVSMAIETYKLAKELGKPGDMNGAIKNIAHLTGNWRTRHENANGEPIKLAYILPDGAEQPIEGEFTEVEECQ